VKENNSQNIHCVCGVLSISTYVCTCICISLSLSLSFFVSLLVSEKYREVCLYQSCSATKARDCLDHFHH